jgi:predicted ATPase
LWYWHKHGGTSGKLWLILQPHPLKTVKQELQLHGHCAELPLGHLRWRRCRPIWRSRGSPRERRPPCHYALGITLFYLGDYAAARTHLEQGMALIDSTAPQAQALYQGGAPGVGCLAMAAHTLWCLGSPAHALRQGQEALAMAQALAHPQSLAFAQSCAAWLHHRRRDAPAVQAQTEALLSLATAQGFPLWRGIGTFWRGWARAMQGEATAGLAQMHQGLAAVVATGETLARPYCLVPLAEALGHTGQVEAGRHLLAEALAELEASGQGDLLAEAYRLQGVLWLQQAVPDMARKVRQGLTDAATAATHGAAPRPPRRRQKAPARDIGGRKRCFEFGHLPQGTSMEATLDSRLGHLTPCYAFCCKCKW